jgi:hypothetical protein
MTELSEKFFSNTRFKKGFSLAYDTLCGKESDKLFPNQWDLFTFGLVYGILFDKTLHISKRIGVVEISNISDKQIQDVICICYLILDDGSGPESIMEKIWDYADGGVKAIYEMYNDYGIIDLPNLIRDAEELWNEKVKSLSNINLN